MKTEKDTLPFHPFYTAKDGWFAGLFLIAVLRGAVLRAQRARPPGQLHPGQPALDAGAHRPRMVFPAVLRDPEARSRSTSSCRRSCGACWRCSPRSCCCSSCRGSTVRRSARAITGRCSSASSGSWWSTCWSSAGPAARPPTPAVVAISQIATAYYFAHFLIILPLISQVRAAAAAAVVDHGVGAARGEGGKRTVRARQERARGRRIKD